MKSRVRRTLAVTGITGAMVLGLAGAVPAASAYTDPAISSCINLVHTDHWYSTTQTLVGTNTCRTGPYDFQVTDYKLIGSETSPCFVLYPGQSAGWRWPRPYRAYYVTDC